MKFFACETKLYWEKKKTFVDSESIASSDEWSSLGEDHHY